MNDTPQNQPADRLPRPVIQKSPWPYLFIWLVPLAALCVAGWYFFDHRQNQGPLLALHFSNAAGLKTKESALQHRGVQVGVVERVELARDGSETMVYVRLNRNNADIARTNSQFWVVRPQISEQMISGLGTILSGPYIDVRPGDGAAANEFTGLEQEPIIEGSGLRIVLHADRLEHLQLNSPVYYRGIQTGAVQDIRLNEDSTGVNVTLYIWRRFAPLVRVNSQFWSVNGADVKGGVFSGVEFKLDSLRALISGGIAFATPEDGANVQPAPDGTGFLLNAEPKKDWALWAPRIELPDVERSADEKTPSMKDAANAAHSSTSNK